MNLAITRQRNLMQQAIGYYEDLKTIERNFSGNDTLVKIKVDIIQRKYAETVTELAKILMETVTIEQSEMIPIQIDTSKNTKIRPT